jgi:hypothetical protein
MLRDSSISKGRLNAVAQWVVLCRPDTAMVGSSRDTPPGFDPRDSLLTAACVPAGLAHSIGGRSHHGPRPDGSCVAHLQFVLAGPNPRWAAGAG